MRSIGFPSGVGWVILESDCGRIRLMLLLFGKEDWLRGGGVWTCSQVFGSQRCAAWPFVSCMFLLLSVGGDLGRGGDLGCLFFFCFFFFSFFFFLLLARMVPARGIAAPNGSAR